MTSKTSNRLRLAAILSLGIVAGCAALAGIEDFSDGGATGGDGMAPPDAGHDVANGGEGGVDALAANPDAVSPDGGDSGGDAGACTLGAQRCSANGVGIETCGATGQWSVYWACTSGACSNGACTNPVATATSCQNPGAGRSDCGGGSDDCCANAEVPGGAYFRTYANSGNGVTGESDPATISNFRLDKYDVTVGRFRAFVGAVLPSDGGAGWLPEGDSGIHVHLNDGKGLSDGNGGYESGWMSSYDTYVSPTTTNLVSCNGQTTATWTATPKLDENLPMTCVNWYEAYAFCIWDGGFLPSEGELEYAAAAGNQQREYPWGSIPPGTGNQYAIYECNYGPPACPSSSSGSCSCSSDYTTANIAPVGFAASGAGAWGQLDLTSNVEQWLFDGWDSAWQYVNPCADCFYGGDGSSRHIRGSSFSDSDVTDLLSAAVDTGGFPAGSPAPVAGFRCARAP